jgi:hypothetical protein
VIHNKRDTLLIVQAGRSVAAADVFVKYASILMKSAIIYQKSAKKGICNLSDESDINIRGIRFPIIRKSDMLQIGNARIFFQ